jgi:cytochrome c-type biogenesis protein CcsB
MHIREGESSESILSSENYLTIKTPNETFSTPVLFSELSYKEVNEKFDLNGRTVRIKSVGFIKGASQTTIEGTSGEAMLELIVSNEQGRESIILTEGEKFNLGNIDLGFELQDVNVRIFKNQNNLLLTANLPIDVRQMSGNEPQHFEPRDTISLQPMQLYTMDGMMLMLKNYYPHASVNVIKDGSGNSPEDAVILEVSDGISKKIVHVMGQGGALGKPSTAVLGDSQFKFTYGSEQIYLPFSLHLTDFQMERYPGSESPSSFASELILTDGERNVSRNVRVFMNNTLNYRGYKFFQSSYDQDERGTVLSVNADMLGTTVTYIGYFLMTLGMILALVVRKSYFRKLIERLKRYSKPVTLLALLIVGLNVNHALGAPSELSSIPKIDQTVINDFSKLWVQGPNGRIEPVSTLASELLRKISRKSNFYDRSPEEVLMGLHLYPELWRNVPLVKISHPQVQQELGVTETRVPLTAFFDQNGNYKLIEQVNAALNKTPAFRNVYEKDILSVDERVNICFMIINGEIISLFPGPNKQTKWYAVGSAPEGLQPNDSLFVNRGFQLLKESLNGKGEVDGKQIIASIAAYQSKNGSDYLPSKSKRNAEIIYNFANPFKRLFPLYLLLGIAILSVLFFNIFRKKTLGPKLKIAFDSLFIIGFIFHSCSLALRWYISGHAPWSNGYESMVYVGWASILAGLIFGRKYPMVLGTSAILSGIVLFVAHLNWMNPEITNLVPVLNSYWLMVHVAIITASYGFIGLSAFLGLLVLILYCLLNDENKANIKIVVFQLTTINEMSITIGLYLLTIGTFLGGVWANESWGRYWGWDAKETWALITVVIYSFIAHMRLIPSLSGIYNYTLASVIGFSSVIMTYFGVNYFLSGLHSYGRGAIDSVHWSVYVIFGTIMILMFISNFKQKSADFES